MNGHDCSNKTLFTKTGTGPDLAWEPPPPPHPHLETFVLASGPGLFLVSVNLVARGIFTVPRGLFPLIQNHFHFVSYSI